MKETVSVPHAPEPAPGSADFDDDGALSRDFLVRRGRCCEEGCRNCPYGFGNGGEEKNDPRETAVKRAKNLLR